MCRQIVAYVKIKKVSEHHCIDYVEQIDRSGKYNPELKIFVVGLMEGKYAFVAIR